MHYRKEVLGNCISPDNKVYGANMGPIWGRQDPVGPHVGPMNFAIWEVIVDYGSPSQINENLMFSHKLILVSEFSNAKHQMWVYLWEARMLAVYHIMARIIGTDDK